jgi:pSer/pThr/pTyr-binding forkhead associated (FHA) protein
MIGRKNTADIPFPEDHHLSNLHAKFYLIDSKMYIEDYSSTNGFVIVFIFKYMAKALR